MRPTVVAAPAQVGGQGDRGTVVVRGKSGNGRTVKLHSTGLVPARTKAVTLLPGTFDAAAPTVDADTALEQVDVARDTDVARFEV